jgi:hypothetical protein
MSDETSIESLIIEWCNIQCWTIKKQLVRHLLFKSHSDMMSDKMCHPTSAVCLTNRQTKHETKWQQQALQEELQDNLHHRSRDDFWQSVHKNETVLRNGPTVTTTKSGIFLSPIAPSLHNSPKLSKFVWNNSSTHYLASNFPNSHWKVRFSDSAMKSWILLLLFPLSLSAEKFLNLVFKLTNYPFFYC